MEYPFVSIVIPTYNRRELLEKCLISISGQTYNKDMFEVIVVDDGSTDGTEKIIDRFTKILPLKYIKQQNLGPSRARNTGCEAAKGEIIGFIDDDAVADKDWIMNGVKYLERKEIGAVEGKVIAYEMDSITPFTHVVKKLKGSLYLGCNVFLRREVFLEVGGYDERFANTSLPYIREDTDLAFSVLEKGYKIIFGDDAIVMHPTIRKKIKNHLDTAKHGFFEPLLYKKHKGIMKNHEKYNIDRTSIIAIPYYYYGYYISGLLFLLSLFFINLNLFYSVVSFSVSHLTTLYARSRKRQISVKDLLVLTFIYMLIPFGRLYYVIKGCIRFRSFVYL